MTGTEVRAVNAEATFSIHEVAARTGLSIATLRYYEQMGVIDAVTRDHSSRHRRYTAEEVETIEAVACLRAVGLSLEDMRTYNELRRQGDAVAVERGAMFKAHLDVVKRQLKHLRARQAYLELKINYWDAKARGDEIEARRLAEDFRARADRLRRSQP
jgi:DNA-binding transcriptional MerR regulator